MSSYSIMDGTSSQTTFNIVERILPQYQWIISTTRTTIAFMNCDCASGSDLLNQIGSEQLIRRAHSTARSQSKRLENQKNRTRPIIAKRNKHKTTKSSISLSFTCVSVRKCADRSQNAWTSFFCRNKQHNFIYRLKYRKTFGYLYEWTEPSRSFVYIKYPQCIKRAQRAQH